MIHDTVTTAGSTVAPASRRRIGDIFVDRGLISDQQLAEALKVQHRTGGRLGEILIELSFITSADAARVLAERLGLDFVDLETTTVDEMTAQRIPEEIARRYRALPIDETDGALRVAMVDPADVFALDDLQVITRANVMPVVADPGQIIEQINSIWTRPSMESRIDDAAELEADDDPIDLLLNTSDDAPIIRLVDAMVSQAVGERASDIHVEPAGDRIRIRFRVDGVLHDASSAPRTVLRPLVSRLKVMASCDISNNRTPQDGRFSVTSGDRSIDLRMTTLPTAAGEAVVLRLLDKSQGVFKLESLGFDAEELERYQSSYQSSQGAILAAGPTGSGKTSTLYATLAELNSPQRSIVSVEDPVEYRMDGIKQIHVGRRGSVGFAGALRAILRADPDVILIGEVRDSETALIAAEAALTGHLVLSTIHTLSASTVPVRLIEMGVEPYLVTSSLRCVVAQRLARRLCEHCKEIAAPTELDIALLALTDDDEPPEELARPVGCSACSKTGYKGRLAVYEILLMNDELCSLVAQRAAGPEIARAAIAAGMRTLRASALARVREGVFGAEELVRVLS